VSLPEGCSYQATDTLLSPLSSPPSQPSLPLHFYSYVKLFGGSFNDAAFAVAADTSNNVYVGGMAAASFTAGSTSFTLRGAIDGLVLKLDSTGTPVFLTGIGGSNNEQINGIAVDSSSSAVYAVGVTTGSSVTVQSTVYTFTNAGGTDAMVVKLSTSTGAPTWVNFFGGTGSDYPTAVACSSSSVVVVGYYTSSMTVGGTTLTNSGSIDGFIVKYNTAGTLQWSVGLGTSGDDKVLGVTMDGNGDIYITGIFTASSITLGSYVLTRVGSSNADIFVAKMDGATGSYLWATSFGSTGTDAAYGITYDSSSSSVYVVGSYSGEKTR